MIVLSLNLSMVLSYVALLEFSPAIDSFTSSPASYILSSLLDFPLKHSANDGFIHGKKEFDWRSHGLDYFLCQFVGSLLSLDADVSWDPGLSYLIIFGLVF